MVETVNGGFQQFRRQYVDLDTDEVATARRSRDYLQQRIVTLAETNRDFPQMYSGTSPFVESGSFARFTKIRPLNDIDFFVLLDGSGLTIRESFWDPELYYLSPKRWATNSFARFMDDAGHINSTRVLNLLKRTLVSVPNYAHSDIHRNGEAVSLKLSSHAWVFDIVPAIPHVNWWSGQIDWYLMPNGKGDWMRSDPRRDAASTLAANRRHQGQLLPLVRLIKYWNTTQLRAGLSSYYVETLCLKVFEGHSPVSTYQEGLERFFRHAPPWVRARCPDPKGLGPRLDRDINWQTKGDVQRVMRTAERATHAARQAERAGNMAVALEGWRSIFGQRFPGIGA